MNKVAKKKAGAVVEAEVSFEEFAGVGLEQVTAEDILVPRLAVLQALSPQVNKRKSEYISGAEVGTIADLGTGELYPDGVWFLPVYYRKDYIEWAPRDSGKGLVNIHTDPRILDGCSRDDRNRPTLSNGNYIAETAQFFGIDINNNKLCYVPMTSTQLKKARRWNTLASGEKLKRADGSEFTAPLFYRTYHLTTAEESNNDGDWFGWKVERGAALPEIDSDVCDWRDLKARAIEFHSSLVAGEVKADTSSLDEGKSSEGSM